MHRKGRQRGWVRVYDRELVDPEGKRRTVHVVDGQVVANGGFIRAPRKPTNQSKSGGSRRTLGALARKAIVAEEMARFPPPAVHYGYCSGYEAVAQEEAQAHPPAVARLEGIRTSSKGGRKFRHHKKNMCYLDGDELDYLSDFDS